MIEIPEAENLSKQLTQTVGGRRIAKVIAGLSPHKFAWYHGNPKDYDALLRGKTVDSAIARGGMVEVHIGDAIVLITDGVILRFHPKDESLPKKHQLLIEFDDTTALSASVQMYGGLRCFKKGDFHNEYYEAARIKPSPLSDKFDWVYFTRLISSSNINKLSVKAFLTTEQRIPGVGNGVLQDILLNAKIHPKRMMVTLKEVDKKTLFSSIKSTLKEMTELGGRETTKDLLGKPGGYNMKLSHKKTKRICPICGGSIIKQPYMGGSIYFCEECQKL
jgi:formamidopyrimidine-DNA glycosylase